MMRALRLFLGLCFVLTPFVAAAIADAVPTLVGTITVPGHFLSK